MEHNKTVLLDLLHKSPFPQKNPAKIEFLKFQVVLKDSFEKIVKNIT